MQFVIFAIAVVSTACCVEWYKKGIRGEDSPSGRVTSAGVGEISVFAFAVSGVFAFAFGCMFADFAGVAVKIGVALSIFSLQYFTDMTVIKKTINGVIASMGDKAK